MVWFRKSCHKRPRIKNNEPDNIIIKAPCSETLYSNLNNFTATKKKKSMSILEKESLKLLKCVLFFARLKFLPTLPMQAMKTQLSHRMITGSSL